MVWDRIKRSGVTWHPAYDLGLPRVSCVFCIFAPEKALLLGGYHNPELLDEYVELEKNDRHSFRVNLKMADIKTKLEQEGFVPEPIQDWTM